MAGQGHKEGPVLTPMEWVPEGDKSKATGGAVYDGVPGYPKGTADKIDQVTFDNSGGFGDVKKAE